MVLLVILIIVIIAIVLSPAIFFLVLGFKSLHTEPKTARIMLIIAGAYLLLLLIGLGYCGSMLS